MPVGPADEITRCDPTMTALYIHVSESNPEPTVWKYQRRHIKATSLGCEVQLTISYAAGQPWEFTKRKGQQNSHDTLNEMFCWNIIVSDIACVVH